MKEAIQGRQADPKPWTSTCLAAGLMDNMRHLEEVIHLLLIFTTVCHWTVMCDAHPD